MITHEQFIQIRFLKTNENLSSAQIAVKLGLNERTVRDWWNLPQFPVKQAKEIELMLESFSSRINELLKDCPTLTGTQIYQKLRQIGYQGSASTIRRYISKMRPVQKRSFLPLDFNPGDALQLDFGDCGYLQQGDHKIRLCVCAAVLCYSRLMYTKIIPSEKQEYTFAFLTEAFNYFGGVPRRLIIDNFKAAVISHSKRGSIEYHPAFLDFCSHYGTIPVACNVRAPYEKGRIENGIGYIKGNFLRGSRFNSIEEAQYSLRSWLDTIANVRIHNTTKKRPVDLFEESEKSSLLPINPNSFDCSRIEHRHVDTRCRIKFDSNHYSVPAQYAGQEVDLRITPDKILIYFDKRLITSHWRSFEKNGCIDDPGHFKIMLEERKIAARQNFMANFLALGNNAAIIKKELENRPVDLSAHLKKIMTLVDMYGKDIVCEALQSAVENQVYGADYVEYIIKLKQRCVDSPSGALHVTNGSDKLALTLNQPDLSVYEQ